MLMAPPAGAGTEPSAMAPPATSAPGATPPQVTAGSGAADQPTQPGAGQMPGDTNEAPADSPECKGFEVLGLQYSPGGSVLPNTCKPYDPITNNPFAIRCIDADPSYSTGFPGDASCILPPPPELGLQFGVHP
jgi:hypothetical protein